MGLIYGVALRVDLGVAFGVDFGVAFGVASGVAFGVAPGVASGVASGAAFGVALGVDSWGCVRERPGGSGVVGCFRVDLMNSVRFWNNNLLNFAET